MYTVGKVVVFDKFVAIFGKKYSSSSPKILWRIFFVSGYFKTNKALVAGPLKTFAASFTYRPFYFKFLLRYGLSELEVSAHFQNHAHITSDSPSN